MAIIFPETQFVKQNGDTRVGFYLDDYLKANLDNYLIAGVRRGHDGVMLVTGLEGTGKSTFTQAIAIYCDANHKLDLSRIVFSGQDLMKAIDTSPPESAIIFDEAIMDMAAQDNATEMQKILIKKFTLIRKKRLFIFLVIPSLFMLRKYFAIFRTRAMINCYCRDGISRGTFRFYSFQTKKELYLRGMKEMNMGAVQPDFSGAFADTYGFFLDAEAYEAKKDDAIRKLTEEKETQEMKLKMAFEDYKLKLKIDVDEFKSVWKDRFNAQKAKYTEQIRELRKKYGEKMNEYKQESIDLQQSRDKKRILELKQNYDKLLFFVYDALSKEYSYRSEEFTENTLKLMLQTAGISNEGLAALKKSIAEGKAYMKLAESPYGMVEAKT